MLRIASPALLHASFNARRGQEVASVAIVKAVGTAELDETLHLN
jgi:hypothetical protein